MPRDTKIYLRDVLQAIERVKSYTTGLDSGSFAADPKTVDAVLHNLEVIGEAAKRIPQSTRSRGAGRASKASSYSH